MTGKQKATAIGATTGAVAGAVVGGPVGAVVGAGVGGYVGHEGTDANGKVSSTTGKASSATAADSTVRSAQAALNDQGYSVRGGRPIWSEHQSAVRRFQADKWYCAKRYARQLYAERTRRESLIDVVGWQ